VVAMGGDALLTEREKHFLFGREIEDRVFLAGESPVKHRRRVCSNTASNPHGEG